MKPLTDLTNPATNPLPDEVQALVAALLEGRVHSLAIVAEVSDAHGLRDWIEGFDLDMDGNESDGYGFIGALSMMLREAQDELMDTRVTVVMDDDDDDDEEGEEL